MAYIYKILNKQNSKFYIGSTNNIQNRWNIHRYELRHNLHSNNYLQNAWNKYGEENFEFVQICEIQDDLQFKLEQWFLNNLKPFPPNGYNILTDTSNGFADRDYEKTKGENHPNSILTKDQVLEIKRSRFQ